MAPGKKIKKPKRPEGSTRKESEQAPGGAKEDDLVPKGPNRPTRSLKRAMQKNENRK